MREGRGQREERKRGMSKNCAFEIYQYTKGKEITKPKSERRRE